MTEISVPHPFDDRHHMVDAQPPDGRLPLARSGIPTKTRMRQASEELAAHLMGVDVEKSRERLIRSIAGRYDHQQCDKQESHGLHLWGDPGRYCRGNR